MDSHKIPSQAISFPDHTSLVDTLVLYAIYLPSVFHPYHAYQFIVMYLLAGVFICCLSQLDLKFISTVATPVFDASMFSILHRTKYIVGTNNYILILSHIFPTKI